MAIKKAKNELEIVCDSCLADNLKHRRKIGLGKNYRDICKYPTEARYKDPKETVLGANGSSMRANLCNYKSK